MIDAAIPFLRCPVCRDTLGRSERSLRCPNRHSFDMARQGYVDLSAGRLPHTGDSAEMVTDRAAFLAAGHYAFIADALAEHRTGDAATATEHRDGDAAATARQRDGDAATATERRTRDATTAAEHRDGDTAATARQRDGDAGELVLDAGTGTGDYLARFLDGSPQAIGIGLDVSKPALRRAARAHPRAAAVLTDLWRPLPVADAVATVILNVFAPRNGAEFHRVLRPDGLLVVVTPAADHLSELVAAHGLIQVDPEKAARVTSSLGDHFALVSTATHRRELELTAAEARTLIGMTPSARHVPADDLPTHDLTVTAAVDVAAYRRH